MSARDFAAKLRAEIQELSEKGQESIQCESLTSALDHFIQSNPAESDAIQIERFKADLQKNIEIEKHNNSASLESFKSIIASGQNAIKTTLLLNGGAAVALLAFIGKLSESNQSKIPDFALSLTIFVIAALCSGISSGTTYISQSLYDTDEKWHELFANLFRYIAITAGAGSLALFAYGIYDSYHSFISLAG
ncbi:hypothetical protein [Pseudomonas mosselii]|uniref:hypothetical protein n=1 Tax=Pseudomonas mosselii TaxID=78327 RepID=UPI0021A4D910|nr:hypothetical protein [Pseudomonas mosselii]UWS68437.1 hypothetical protein N0U38_06475 [Pseudomonas mosselii]